VPGHQARYPAGYPRRPPGGGGHHVPVSRRLSAAGVRFSVIRFPPRSWALLTVGLPGKTTPARTSTGLPRSARVSYDRGGCPLYPGDGGAHPGLSGVPSRRLPLLSGQSLHPAPTSHLTRAHFTRHQRGFKQFTRPVFPSPAAVRMERATAWAFPQSFAPRRPGADNARQGGDRPSSTDLKLLAQHHISVDPPVGSSLTACDLVSQRHKRASRACSLRASARIEAVVRAGRRCWAEGRDERRRPPDSALLLSPKGTRRRAAGGTPARGMKILTAGIVGPAA
jgi:hypothetical protein